MNAFSLDPAVIRTDWLERWALYRPDQVALQDADTGTRYTYAQAAAVVNRAAGVLRDDFGLQRGDRLAVLAANELEYVFLLFAAQKIGAILVPLNFRLAPRELEWILADSDPALLVVQAQFEETARQVGAAALRPRRVAFDGPGGLVARMLDARRSCQPVPQVAELETPCMILYTSGTTGRPKGAILTPGLIFWNSVNTMLRLDLLPTDVALTFTPLFHTGGWNVLTTPLLHRGGRVVFLKKFDADRVLELCDAEGVSILFGLPTIMDMLYRAPRFATAKLAQVRYAIVGGEPMPLPLIRAWHERGIPIRQGYGLTEFGPNDFSLQQEHAETKIGSIGFPNFYVDARVVDDADVDVPDGEVGELVLRGPACMPGYWRNPEATAEAIRDGWFHTGDLVRRDAEGFYYVVDRKKDMYKSGGENVYPVEVETFLRTHPQIHEVSVVGVPDQKWGEVGLAWVAPAPGQTLTADDVIEFCRGNLARYKIPKHVRFLAELPRGDSGKVLKRELKARAAERLAQPEVNA